jgi:hypothetical protein
LDKARKGKTLRKGGRLRRTGSEQLTEARNCALTVKRVTFEVHIREKETASSKWQ